jgi:hypothetical protein
MDVKVGDAVVLDAGETQAQVVNVLEDGAIEAQIVHPGHPGDGEITRVASGNFSLGTVDFNAAAAKTAPVEQPVQPAPTAERAVQKDQLDEYHTVTR